MNIDINEIIGCDIIKNKIQGKDMLIIHNNKSPKIDSNAYIAPNAVICGDVTIGKNSIIAAGSVVTKNIPENVMAAGVPAVVKKELS